MRKRRLNRMGRLGNDMIKESSLHSSHGVARSHDRSWCMKELHDYDMGNQRVIVRESGEKWGAYSVLATASIVSRGSDGPSKQRIYTLWNRDSM